jgi:hypothetical protein
MAFKPAACLRQVSFYRQHNGRKSAPKLLPWQTSICPGEVTWRLNDVSDDVISKTLDSTQNLLEITAKPVGKAKAYLLHFYHNMKDGCETLPKQYNPPTVSAARLSKSSDSEFSWKSEKAAAPGRSTNRLQALNSFVLSLLTCCVRGFDHFLHSNTERFDMEPGVPFRDKNNWI